MPCSLDLDIVFCVLILLNKLRLKKMIAVEHKFARKDRHKEG